MSDCVKTSTVIASSVDGMPRSSATAQNQAADRVELGIPAGRHDAGRAGFLDQRRSGYDPADGQPAAIEDFHLSLAAIEDDGAHAGCGRCQRALSRVDGWKVRLLR